VSNPLIAQGTLNRLLASVQVISFPSLNVTRGFLGKEQVSLSPEGPSSDYIESQVGAVPSPRPYQVMTVGIHLLKSQGLAALWEAQRLKNTTIGDVVVRSDSAVLPIYYIQNATFYNVGELAFAGESNDYMVTLRGTYPINSSLYG
jgi:hypothetical protein